MLPIVRKSRIDLRGCQLVDLNGLDLGKEAFRESKRNSLGFVRDVPPDQETKILCAEIIAHPELLTPDQQKIYWEWRAAEGLPIASSLDS